jgi:riboflavin synthase
MFTGIVQGTGAVLAVTPDGRRVRLRVALPPRAQGAIEVGASVALAGVCLTFVAGSPEAACFDVIDETLRLTTLGALRPGDPVNVERAARVGDEIGGHLLSGHISGGATVVGRLATDTSLSLTLQLDPALRPYVLPKGYVGLDGCSLTVGDRVDEAGSFEVHLIPETLRVTTLGALRAGDRVNVEVDAMTQAVVDTVERVMARRVAG